MGSGAEGSPASASGHCDLPQAAACAAAAVGQGNHRSSCCAWQSGRLHGEVQAVCQHEIDTALVGPPGPGRVGLST
jgi:hypothetical protein